MTGAEWGRHQGSVKRIFLLLMYFFALGSCFTLSENSFLLLPSPLPLSEQLYFWSWLYFMLPRDHHHLDVSFHSNTTYPEPVGVMSNLPLSFCRDYTCPYQAEKRCYQAGAFLSLPLLRAWFQARLPIALRVPLHWLRDWSLSLLLGTAPQY